MYKIFKVQKYALKELLEVDILWTQKIFVTRVELGHVSEIIAVKIEAFANFIGVSE
jgi:hypothetical protein